MDETSFSEMLKIKAFEWEFFMRLKKNSNVFYVLCVCIEFLLLLDVCNMCIICVVFSFILVIIRYRLWHETGGQDRKVLFITWRLLGMRFDRTTSGCVRVVQERFGRRSPVRCQ
jgi:hypothetical protein